ncbi:MAG: sigma 54-interacting transcriptional regulator [Tepidisphaeraceae bacterium]
MAWQTGHDSPRTATPTAAVAGEFGDSPLGRSENSGRLLNAGPDVPAMVGQSEALAFIRETATSIAARKCTVLVLGETGTGKEMLARHIHAHSDRVTGPFVPVDCSALTDTLFESQLFGHLRGSFTGAVRDSLGFIRSADGGTLFLDEIGELSLPLQSKLLRVIQERAVVPVGDTRAKPVDVRLVCATHRDLRKMVADGQFRQDLFFRLNVVSLHLPPLRERRADVLPLAQHFLTLQAELYNEAARRIDAGAALVLENYPWPGNVRELANAIEHAHVLTSAGGTITVAELPDRLKAFASPRAISQPTDDAVPLEGNVAGSLESVVDLTLATLEKRAMQEALRRTKGNKAAASRLLGLNIQRFNRMIDRLGVLAK